MNPFAPMLFHRYPKYLRLVWSRIVIPWLVRRQGVALDGRVNFAGCPIVSMVTGSRISIGKGTLLCSRSHATALGVAHPVILRTLSSGAEIVIGKEVRMSGTTICAARKVEIGDRVCIGANVTIVDTDFHSLHPYVRAGKDDAFRALIASVRIENDVFIGAGCYILKGVTIGEGAVVGAASVVTKDVPSGVVVAGNPARIVGVVPGKSHKVGDPL